MFGTGEGRMAFTILILVHLTFYSQTGLKINQAENIVSIQKTFAKKRISFLLRATEKDLTFEIDVADKWPFIG